MMRLWPKTKQSKSAAAICPTTGQKFEMEQLSNGVKLHPVLMKKNELTPKQVSSVPCPTCGVATRKSSVLHSGGPRSRPQDLK